MADGAEGGSSFSNSAPGGTQRCLQGEINVGNDISYHHIYADVGLQKIEIYITAVDWFVKQKCFIDLMAAVVAFPEAAKNFLSAGRNILSGEAKAVQNIAPEAGVAGSEPVKAPGGGPPEGGGPGGGGPGPPGGGGPPKGGGPGEGTPPESGSGPSRPVNRSKWRTDPTGQRGGAPTGRRTTNNPKADSGTKRSVELENEAADKLANAGYKVEQNPQVPGAKNPDYRIEGEIFDGYSPHTSNASTVRNEIALKVSEGQADRIVLNLTDSNLTRFQLRQELAQFPIPGLKEIILIDKIGNIVRFFP